MRRGAMHSRLHRELAPRTTTAARLRGGVKRRGRLRGRPKNSASEVQASIGGSLHRVRPRRPTLHPSCLDGRSRVC